MLLLFNPINIHEEEELPQQLWHSQAKISCQIPPSGAKHNTGWFNNPVNNPGSDGRARLHGDAMLAYLAAYQLSAHLASTNRSTFRKFFPLKGLDMHSTTIALAISADSVGPSSITSSCT